VGIPDYHRDRFSTLTGMVGDNTGIIGHDIRNTQYDEKH
jgi:hypothetical protein